MESAIETQNIIDLDVSPEYTEIDIKTYVENRVREAETLRLGNRLLGGGHQVLEDEVIETILSHANGM